MTETPIPAVTAALRDAQGLSLVSAYRAGLEQLAYAWYAQAIELDHEWPDHDETVVDDSETAEYVGHAAGLRQAAIELLEAIKCGKICTKCGDPIGDPTLPEDEGERCRGCADPG
jgi:RNA polymerase-binding transcription factor DksA